MIVFSESARGWIKSLDSGECVQCSTPTSQTYRGQQVDAEEAIGPLLCSVPCWEAWIESVSNVIYLAPGAEPHIVSSWESPPDWGRVVRRWGSVAPSGVGCVLAEHELRWVLGYRTSDGVLVGLVISRTAPGAANPGERTHVVDPDFRGVGIGHRLATEATFVFGRNEQLSRRTRDRWLYRQNTNPERLFGPSD